MNVLDVVHDQSVTLFALAEGFLGLLPLRDVEEDALHACEPALVVAVQPRVRGDDDGGPVPLPEDHLVVPHEPLFLDGRKEGLAIGRDRIHGLGDVAPDEFLHVVVPEQPGSGRADEHQAAGGIAPVVDVLHGLEEAPELRLAFPEGLLRSLLFRDVADDRKGADDIAPGVPQGGRRHQGADPLAILADQLQLIFFAYAVMAPADAIQIRVADPGFHELIEGMSQHLLLGVAEHGGHLGVHEGDARLPVSRQDAFVHLLHQAAVLQFPGQQSFFGAAALLRFLPQLQGSEAELREELGQGPGPGLDDLDPCLGQHRPSARFPLWALARAQIGSEDQRRRGCSSDLDGYRQCLGRPFAGSPPITGGSRA